jgi:predicted phosphodiesterase
MKTTNKAKLVIKYCKEYPDKSTKALSELIFNKYNHIFDSYENARSLVRYYRNERGKEYKKSEIVEREFHHILPVEDSEDYKPYILKEVSKIGILSDIHIPNHRNRELNLALKKFDELEVDCIIINGDLLDNTPYTKFLTPPDKKDARRYLNMADQFLQGLRDSFPEAKIIWAEGNHDFWYYQYLMRKAPELYGDPYYHLQHRLKLHEKNIEFIAQTSYIMAGKLAICHGHYLVRGVFTPVSAARTVMMKAKVPCIIGHVHKTSEFTQTDLHGQIVTTWSTGCLCTLTPDYQPMGGDANYGFASVELAKDGNFHVNNYRIYNGKIL